MSAAIIIIHVIVCFALIVIVLLQTGKGADMGSAFGGGASQTLFGTTGATTFLGKATTVAAVIFMVTSVALAYFSTNRMGDSIMTDRDRPVEEKAAPDKSTEQTGDTSKQSVPVENAKPEATASAQSATEMPVPQSATETPAPQTVTTAPVTQSVTDTPAPQTVTTAPVTQSATETPAPPVQTAPDEAKKPAPEESPKEQ